MAVTESGLSSIGDMDVVLPVVIYADGFTPVSSPGEVDDSVVVNEFELPENEHIN